MAAAEYYNASAAQMAPQHSPHQQSPYQQSPYQQAQELHGSPMPQFNLPHAQQHSQQGPPPPPYYAVQQDHKPSVHFAHSSPPSQNRPSSGPNSGRPSFSSPRPTSGPNSGRPSFSSPRPSNHGQLLQLPPHHFPHAQSAAPNGIPPAAMQPPHMRPYMNGNQSEYSLGYSSDPEEKRRRRHKRHEHRHDDDSSREIRDSKTSRHRSRSTNADSFLGAAGGGLIGDLIFPGLGTVGGAVAGWIGGNNFGKRRKDKEGRREQEQREWEHKFRDRSNSDDRRSGHHHHSHHDDHRSPSRHRDGY